MVVDAISDTAVAALAGDHFGWYRRALDAGIGEIESARFELDRAGTQVIAYSRSDSIVFALVARPCGGKQPKARFLFVGTALALSSHFGALVVPAQVGLHPVFTYPAPAATIQGYRFCIGGGARFD